MGLLILVVTLIVFATIVAAWLIARILDREGFELPRGDVATASYRDCKVWLVTDPDALVADFARTRAAARCARAVWATREAWRKQGRTLDEASRRVVVHAARDSEYVLRYDNVAAELYARAGYAGVCCSSNASLWTAHTRRRSQIAPLVAIRASAFGATVESGALVIHEITHWLAREEGGDADLEHDDETLWAPHPGAVEVRASQAFYGAA